MAFLTQDPFMYYIDIWHQPYVGQERVQREIEKVANLDWDIPSLWGDNILTFDGINLEEITMTIVSYQISKSVFHVSPHVRKNKLLLLGMKLILSKNPHVVAKILYFCYMKLDSIKGNNVIEEISPAIIQHFLQMAMVELAMDHKMQVSDFVEAPAGRILPIYNNVKFKFNEVSLNDTAFRHMFAAVFGHETFVNFRGYVDAIEAVKYSPYAVDFYKDHLSPMQLVELKRMTKQYHKNV